MQLSLFDDLETTTESAYAQVYAPEEIQQTPDLEAIKTELSELRAKVSDAQYRRVLHKEISEKVWPKIRLKQSKINRITSGHYSPQADEQAAQVQAELDELNARRREIEDIICVNARGVKAELYYLPAWGQWENRINEILKQYPELDESKSAHAQVCAPPIETKAQPECVFCNAPMKQIKADIWACTNNDWHGCWFKTNKEFVWFGGGSDPRSGVYAVPDWAIKGKESWDTEPESIPQVYQPKKVTAKPESDVLPPGWVYAERGTAMYSHPSGWRAYVWGLEDDGYFVDLTPPGQNFPSHKDVGGGFHKAIRNACAEGIKLLQEKMTALPEDSVLLGPSLVCYCGEVMRIRTRAHSYFWVCSQGHRAHFDPAGVILISTDAGGHICRDIQQHFAETGGAPRG